MRAVLVVAGVALLGLAVYILLAREETDQRAPEILGLAMAFEERLLLDPDDVNRVFDNVNVQSRRVMERAFSESVWFICPAACDELERR